MDADGPDIGMRPAKTGTAATMKEMAPESLAVRVERQGRRPEANQCRLIGVVAVDAALDTPTTPGPEPAPREAEDERPPLPQQQGDPVGV